ncbi:hypothetical protein EDB83DRAFT_2518320 [Lactarius deliciosus]|nr:hypothetical protein EDB83DRAFT_2518320 [Lactarius deliciosus]
MIAPPVLGMGINNSPGKLADDESSPIRGFCGMQPSRTTGEDDEEEEGGIGQVQVQVPSGRCGRSWRKELADEIKADSDESDDDDGPRAHAISAPVFIDSRRRLRVSGLSQLLYLCSRKRRVPYVSERDGGSHRAAPIPASKSKRTGIDATNQAAPNGENDNDGYTAARQLVLAWQQSAHRARSHKPWPPLLPLPPSPPHRPPARSLNPRDCKRRRYMFIGILLKAWGRLVSLPDPEHDLPEQQKKTKKGKGKTSMARRRRRRRSASLTPMNDNGDGDKEGKLDEGGDADVDAGADADDGIWPGEYMVPVPLAQADDGGEDHTRGGGARYRCRVAISTPA